MDMVILAMAICLAMFYRAWHGHVLLRPGGMIGEIRRRNSVAEAAAEAYIHAHRGERGIIPLLRVQKNVTGQRFLED